MHFDSSREIILICDSSPYGVGAVIFHWMEDGSEQPIGYVSCSLSSAKMKYSQLEKQALTIIFRVKKFHPYLYGQSFMIYADQ